VYAHLWTAVLLRLLLLLIDNQGINRPEVPAA
jgi:hypothetical protein